MSRLDEKALALALNVPENDPQRRAILQVLNDIFLESKQMDDDPSNVHSHAVMALNKGRKLNAEHALSEIEGMYISASSTLEKLTAQDELDDDEDEKPPAPSY